MRRRPSWYTNVVERPLGAKQVPVVPARPIEDDLLVTQNKLQELDDTRLLELSTAVIDEIADGLNRGEDPETLVVAGVRPAGHRPTPR